MLLLYDKNRYFLLGNPQLAIFCLIKIFGSLFFLYFCSRKELLGSKRMHIAEIRTVAKSLPLLRRKTRKLLILSYSAVFQRNFIKKSLTREMFIRIEICSNNLRRIKPIVVRHIVSINCPNSINHIKPIFLFLMPISTMAWVRNGNINCNKQPTSNPKII